MIKYHILKLLSDENRYNIFTKLLEYDGLCVSEIEGLLGAKQANISKHLKKFKDLDILEAHREKNMIRYKVKESFLNEHVDLIKYLMM